MIRVYIGAIVGAFILCAYWAGGRVATEKCHATNSHQSSATQIQIIKQTEKINAETLNTGMRDIRRILRAKYTIAE